MNLLRPARAGRPPARALLLALSLAVPPAAAAVPDWLAATVAEPLPELNPNLASVELLNAQEVHYLARDHARSRWYGAIKILNPAAFNVTPVSMRYTAGTDHIVSAHAWVLSGDRRKAKAFGQGDFTDLVQQLNQYSWDQQRVLAFDGGGQLEVGGVIGWDIELDSPSGVLGSTWNFASAYAVLHGRFEISPPPGASLQWHATSAHQPPPVPGRDPGSLRWETGAQMPFLTGRPAGFIPNPRAISVQCVPARPSPGAAGWGAQARIAAGVIEPRIEASGPVQARAQALVGGRSGRWERIRALTEFVQRDIVYLEVTIDQDFLAGYRPHPASEVLRNRLGDCKDKATLLVSLLRSVGEEAQVVLVNAGNPAATAKDWPSLDFNHAIVALRADDDTPADWPVVTAGRLGRLVLFDPTDSITPLGVLTAADQGGYVLVLDPAGGELVQAPVAEPLANRVERTINARVGDRGELQAKVVETFHGMSAAAVEGARFGLGAARFKQRLVARVHLATPLAEAVAWSDQWTPASAQYRLAFGFQSDRYGRVMGDDMMMVSPRVLPETTALLPWQTRAEGIVWLPGEALDEDVHLTLPAGFAIEEMPENWTEAAAAATGDLSYRAEGGAVVYRCRLTRRGGFFDRRAYESLRAFEARLLQAERRPILIRRAAAGPPPPAAGS